MGMFYKKLMESAVEKSVEDAIQTPDDVGVDLDAIEDAIVGKDGIEAHRDEVEAADDGVVGDPLEEATIIMYESEYNFNQIMRCIGVAELNEVATGRDFMLEGANLDAFFEKARQVFTKMFEHITKVFKNAIVKMSEKMNLDKALVKKYEKEIRAGFEKKDNWKFTKAYDMNKLNAEYAPKKSDLWNQADADINEVLSGGEWSEAEKMSHIKAVKRVADIDVSAEGSAAGEMVAKLKEGLFVNTEYNGSNNDLLNTVIEILKNDNDIKKIRNAYKELKNDYKELMKWLKDIKSKLNAKKNEETNQAAQHVCMSYITAARYEKNLQHSYFALVIKAHNTRRSQARRMALAWQRLGSQKSEPKKDTTLPKLNAKNEGAFLNINII